jgi:hypothetical protein
VPAGNPRGGQWSNRNEGGAGVGFGGSGSGDGKASAQGTGGAEDTGSTGGSQDAATSEAESSQQPEGDGTRGYDDRLAAWDKPSLGRTAMLGIMARAAEKVVQLYRSENLLLDLFGQRDGAVALTTIDDKNIFGSNSTSPTYADADRKAAKDLRDKLVAKYPDAMRADNVGYTPNNALFHARQMFCCEQPRRMAALWRAALWTSMSTGNCARTAKGWYLSWGWNWVIPPSRSSTLIGFFQLRTAKLRPGADDEEKLLFR